MLTAILVASAVLLAARLPDPELRQPTGVILAVQTIALGLTLLRGG